MNFNQLTYFEVLKKHRVWEWVAVNSVVCVYLMLGLAGHFPWCFISPHLMFTAVLSHAISLESFKMYAS